MKRIICLIIAVSISLSVACAVTPKNSTEEKLVISYDNIGDYVKKSNTQLKMMQVSIDGMDSAIRSLQSTYTTEQNAARETLKDSVKVTRINLDATRELMVYMSQIMISSVYSIDFQLNNLDLSIATLERKLSVLNIMYSLGYSTISQSDELKQNIQNLQNAKTTLTIQKNNILKQINLAIGRKSALPLEIEEFKPVVALNSSGEILTDSDYEKEYKIAYNKNYSLQSAKTSYEEKENNNQFSGETRAEYIALNNARTEFETNFKTAFDDIFYQYSQIDLAHSKYITEKANFDIAQAKYDVGEISANDYEDEKTALQTEENNIKTAQLNYTNAYLKYRAYLNGATPQ